MISNADRLNAEVMANIHANCVAHGTESDGNVDPVKGTNIAGFAEVADAMLAYGAVEPKADPYRNPSELPGK